MLAAHALKIDVDGDDQHWGVIGNKSNQTTDGIGHLAMGRQ